MPCCPAAIPATFDYLCARDQSGDLAVLVTGLAAVGTEVDGG